MNDALKEQVSALADDELRREEQGFLLRRVAQSPELAARLGRYGLIGEAMRGTLPPVIDSGLARRVAAALEEESAHKAAGFGGHRLLRPLAGIAVAASVAAVSLAIWPVSETAPGGGSEFAASGAPASGLQRAAADPGQTYDRWERLEPQIQQRLNDYLVNHSEHTATGRFGGMLNYVRITGHHHDD